MLREQEMGRQISVESPILRAAVRQTNQSHDHESGRLVEVSTVMATSVLNANVPLASCTMPDGY